MTQTLLVADDSKTIHKIVEMALKASQYNVVSVNSAQGALEAANHSPNVILLDYYMPDGSGYDVCRALKENAQTRSIPIVMLGGTYKNFDENLARQAGADGVLIKPFKTDALLEILQAASSGQLVAAAPAFTPPPAEEVRAAPTYEADLRPAPIQPPPAAGLPVYNPPPVVSSFAPPVPTMDDEQHTQPVDPDEIEVVSAASQPRIPVAPAVSAAIPTKSGSGLSSIALTRSEIESLIKDEVKASVKAELPGLLRTILGEVFQQKVLPKLMARADQRVEAAIDEAFTTKIQEHVRTELESLLAD